VKRELLLSFAGHGLLVAAVALLTAGQRVRDSRRPQVITVQILSAGLNSPKPAAQGTHLVQPAPRSQARPKPQSQAKPAAGSDVVRKQGLGARVDGASALGYNYYLAQMLDRIGASWSDPYSGASRRFKATVVFVIERDGSLKEAAVETGSGDRLYDDACLRAVQVTDRLPPLPPEFTAPRLKIHLEFEF
jgi:TonB family protein